MTDLVPASDARNPTPCLITIHTTAALNVAVDLDNGLVVLLLAADDGVQLHLSPESALALSVLLAGSARALRDRLP
jgi:hypothetical protein